MDKILLVIWLWFLGTGYQENKVQIDKEQDNVYVVTHAANLVSFSSFNDTERGYLSPADTIKSCNECHSDMLEGETIHAPAKKDCQRCHIANGAEHPLEAVVGFTLKADVPNLCYECHDHKDEKEFVHDPIKKGDCLTCHDIHNSPNMYLVKKDPVAGLCLDCHELNIPEGNLVHGAVTEGNCTGCHNPHQADEASFLKTNKLDRLCRSCHKPIRKELKMDVLHDPFKKKDCFSCHNSHSSKEAHLSDLKIEALCLSCHEDTHTEITTAKVVHEAVTSGLACLNCHVPHASAQEHILFTNEKDVCLTCHDKVIETEDRNITAISASLQEGNTIHGPITLDECSVCHEPHASQEHTLLTLKFPEEQYTVASVDNFSLCFDCHDDKLLTSPTTESATNFRNGDQNLHYLHIQGTRGRNCNLCHDVHGAKNEYMIKRKTQYGNWNMPIKFEHTDNGGSCLTGCHERYKYKRIVLSDSINIKN